MQRWSAGLRRLPIQSSATSNIVLPTIGDGVYEASGANFAQVGPLAGHDGRSPQRAGTIALTSFTVEVPDAAGNLTINRVNQADPFASPSHLFTTDQLGGMALVLLGLLPLVLRRQLWGFGPVAGAASDFCGVAGLIAGGTLFFAAHQEGTVDYTLLANPVPVTNENVAAGKALYIAELRCVPRARRAMGRSCCKGSESATCRSNRPRRPTCRRRALGLDNQRNSADSDASLEG